MSKIFKIIIGLILCISVLIAAAYASRGYWMGSLLIYAFSDMDDRNNLNIVPEKYKVAISNNSNCSELEFYGYRMCLSWDDIIEKSPNENEEIVTFIRFNDGPLILIYNPASEGDIRSDFQIFAKNDRFSELSDKSASEMRSAAAVTLTSSNYTFLKNILYSTHDSDPFFSPFIEKYQKLILLLGKIEVCKIKSEIYSDKIYSFNTERVKGFQINYPPYKDGEFTNLYVFPNDDEYLKISILGRIDMVKQDHIDMIISSIHRTNNV